MPDNTDSDESSSGGGGGSISWYILVLLGCWASVWRRNCQRDGLKVIAAHPKAIDDVSIY